MDKGKGKGKGETWKQKSDRLTKEHQAALDNRDYKAAGALRRFLDLHAESPRIWFPFGKGQAKGDSRANSTAQADELAALKKEVALLKKKPHGSRSQSTTPRRPRTRTRSRSASTASNGSSTKVKTKLTKEQRAERNRKKKEARAAKRENKAAAGNSPQTNSADAPKRLCIACGYAYTAATAAHCESCCCAFAVDAAPPGSAASAAPAQPTLAAQSIGGIQ